MFFSDRVKSIKPGDRVLEVGPGSSPFPRSDVLLELKYSCEEEYLMQCGDGGMKGVDSRVIYYDGLPFPFKDGEFDYIICSHVLEHVHDIEEFCSEVFRVAKAGYFEYPLVYYEYVYDIPAHVNLIKKVGNELVYLPKALLLGMDTAPIRQFWYATLNAGHVAAVRSLLTCLMEGFEWQKPFKLRQAADISELLNQTLKDIPPPIVDDGGIRRHLIGLFNALYKRAALTFYVLLERD